MAHLFAICSRQVQHPRGCVRILTNTGSLHPRSHVHLPVDVLGNGVCVQFIYTRVRTHRHLTILWVYTSTINQLQEALPYVGMHAPTRSREQGDGVYVQFIYTRVRTHRHLDANSNGTFVEQSALETTGYDVL